MTRYSEASVEELTTDEAFVRYRETRDSRLRDRLVEEYVGLAYFVAGKFAGRGIEREDLNQVALIALLGALERFDHERGVAFSSFAVPTITGALKRQFRDSAWLVRPPRRTQERSLAISVAVSSLSLTLGRTPTTQELAAHSDWAPSDVEDALLALASRERVSFDADDHTMVDRASDDAFSAAEDRASLAPMLAKLKPSDRAVIRWYFADCLTQREIGERVGVSQMQVSRLIHHSVEALRHAAAQRA